MLPAIGPRLGTLRRRLFLLLAAASVIAVVGVNLIWLPGALRDVHDARRELQLVAVRGVRDQIDFFLADKEEGLTTVAQLFRAAVIDGDPKGLAIVGQRFLARERAFEEVGIFEPPRTWRYRLSRREVALIASGYEWTCPKCGKLNHEISVPELDEDMVNQGTIICTCGKRFRANTPEHAYE